MFIERDQLYFEHIALVLHWFRTAEFLEISIRKSAAIWSRVIGVTRCGAVPGFCQHFQTFRSPTG